MTRPDVHVFTTRFPVDVYEALRNYAFFVDRSINDTVLEAVYSYLVERAEGDQVEAMVDEARVKFRAVIARLHDN